MENLSLENLLISRHYVEGYQPPEENVLLRIRNEIIGSAGNFIVLSGLPKSGKSTFLNAIISSYFVGETLNLRLQLIKNKLFFGYFDTESAPYDFYKNINRIKLMSNQTILGNNFNAFNTRQDPALINKLLIEQYISSYPVSVVFVDGLLDLVNNYNDEVESRQLIDWLKLITTKYNILLIGVIHTGKKDNHTLGHFGSMIDRYAQSILEVTKDKEQSTFTLSAKYLRSAPEFEPITIKWNGNRYIECEYIEKENAPIRKSRR